MKLSMSNIAWQTSQDEEMYAFLQGKGFRGLEIAPTRLFPEKPYEHNTEAKEWAKALYERYGLNISSMQSIWYGRDESIFGTAEERQRLIDYTKRAIDFAHAIDCKNLVFGCPRNRNLPEASLEVLAYPFFQALGDYAAAAGTVIALEANPPIYQTNYLNTTAQTVALCRALNNPGVQVNLDAGTMLYNEETVASLTEAADLIHHIHISEPNLAAIEARPLHKALGQLPYTGYVSIEMKQAEMRQLKQVVSYVQEAFS